jgi:hypothetical protein
MRENLYVDIRKVVMKENFSPEITVHGFKKCCVTNNFNSYEEDSNGMRVRKLSFFLMRVTMEVMSILLDRCM